jgi:hypothetical protein
MAQQELVGTLSQEDFSFLRDSHETLENLLKELARLDREKFKTNTYLNSLEKVIEDRLVSIREAFKIPDDVKCEIIGNKIYTITF